MNNAVMPAVWGSGQLLAFSGVDGPTDWAEPFVLTTGEPPGTFTVRLPTALDVKLTTCGAIDWGMLLGDAGVGECSAGRVAFAFADHHTLYGCLPSGCVLRVGDAQVQSRPTPVWSSAPLVLLAWQHGEMWGLALRSDKDARPVNAGADLDDLIDKRSAFVTAVEGPDTINPDHLALLKKAVSVMKVNVHAPQGCISTRWSTPDRWPHQHMWLWDSAFHAVGMSYVDIGLAQDELLAMLEQVDEAGMLAHMIKPDGSRSAVTQPPILAWAVHHVMEHGGDLDWVRECVPYLRRYLDWDRTHRDRNGNGIPEWHIEGNPLCRCGESGLDNSSVYDRAVELDAPDFAAFLYNDYECLADIAEHVGDETLAAHCHAAADPIATAVNRLLWHHDFYYHCTMEGEPVPVKAVSGFMPLFAGIPDVAQARILADHLRCQKTFGAAARIPSEALNSGTYCKDMWRGPAWMNLSYLVVLGLRRYGFCAAAEELKDNMIETVLTWYLREGSVFEFYDSLGLTSPRDLDRKQRLISGKGIAPIADYHWTAAVTAALLLE